MNRGIDHLSSFWLSGLALLVTCALSFLCPLTATVFSIHGGQGLTIVTGLGFGSWGMSIDLLRDLEVCKKLVLFSLHLQYVSHLPFIG